MIAVNRLSHKYSDELELHFPEWEVAKNHHALILGSSGSGKTTFLHLLGGLLRPTSGSIKVEGTEIQRLSSSQMDKFRGAHMGFIFQSPHLLRSLTVSENIRLASYLGGKKHSIGEVKRVLGELGIEALANRKIHQISQGQAQRVAIARAVINEPDYIFGDEPTASLDDQSCQAVINLLKDEAERHHATLVIATHDQRIKDAFENQLTL